MHSLLQQLNFFANNPFPDATAAFFERFEAMVDEAVGGDVQIARPFERYTKSQVMQLGRHLPLELTFSCLSPINGLHCGQCNKCAERKAAFRIVGLPDPFQFCALCVLCGLSLLSKIVGLESAAAFAIDLVPLARQALVLRVHVDDFGDGVKPGKGDAASRL